jgi:outer membrane lipoprotein-sorting protein
MSPRSIQMPIIALFCLFAVDAVGAPAGLTDAEVLVDAMRTAYARVADYQATVEVRDFAGDDRSTLQRFRYTFKKPNLVRLDLESPHRGMILVYPDRNGKVTMKSPYFFTLHLSPDSSLLGTPTGQRIDQTDLGLLVTNISRSLTDQRRGPAEIVDENDYIRIRVLARNHFREGVVTLYGFLVDKALLLPVRVEELTPGGKLERIVVFEDLRINTGVPDALFRIE